MMKVVQEVQIIRHKKPKDLIRPVIRINGVWTTVKGYGTANEPAGRFDAWIPVHLEYKKYLASLYKNELVKARLRLVDNRWTVINFMIDEPEPEQTKEQVLSDEAFATLGEDY